MHSPAFAPPLSLPRASPLPRRRQRPPTCLLQPVRLGQTDVAISAIGAGTRAWGDASRGYGRTFGASDTAAAAAYLLAHGVNFVDTSERYGARAGAEALLGDALAAAPPAVLCAQYCARPWAGLGAGGGVRLGRGAVRDALRASLTRMGRASVDVYYLAGPALRVPGVVDGMADCVEGGLVGHVGLANHGVGELRAAHAAFKERGVQVVANQFRFHILEQGAVYSGLLEETLALGVTPVAYEPLARGLLTGKYTDGEASPGRRYTPPQLKLYKQLTNLMRFVGATSGGTPRSIAEVALAYCAAKGVVPIPGVNTEGQARELVRALDWRMDADVVGVLDEKSAYIQKQRV